MRNDELINFGREKMIERLREEVIGPHTQGKLLDLKNLEFENFQDMAGPWIDKDSKQEILTIRPRNRYGAGILYPVEEVFEQEEDDLELENELNTSDLADTIELSDFNLDSEESLFRLEEETSSITEELPELESVRKPSSMGLSFIANLNKDGILNIKLKGGYYTPITVKNKQRKNNQNETWYLRNPFEINGNLFENQFTNLISPKKIEVQYQKDKQNNLNIELMAYVRPWGEGQYLITITAINRTNSNVKSSHSNCLFQTEIEINVENGFFNPYQSSPSLTNAKLETEIYREKALIDDLSSELLFSNYKSFAIGHNCSTNWKLIDNKVESIFANCFPIFETPSITPDITFADGNKVSISMQDLAELKNKSNTILSLQKIIDEYEIWIENQKANFQKDFSKIQFKKAFDSNLQDCLIAINKMRKGLNLLENNDLAFKAFTIANEAMYLQQARSKLPLRDTIIEKDGRFKVLGKYPIHIENNSIGTWRAFQIAYILSVIESIANPDSSEREVVDLIFFPTGGGKTEAYLGVIAFTIIYRRLINPEDSGTAVMMRYTLRLLTTQQFLRAASLICALELIRKNSNELLGSAEIAIGAWLGGSVTPNRRQDAIKALESMQKDIKKRPWKKDNPFLVLQCPWCAAKLGPVDQKNNLAKNSKIPGYESVLTMPRTVRIKCPDILCEFSKGLPLIVVDEDIYYRKPTLIIGTVDKFALMAWKPESRAMFGLGTDGTREVSPPNLIIQDEFHLISGPLGSMVGLYETVIEELCSTEINGKIIRPKIISSTATIRRFWAQANAVYGRSEVSLFPPPLLDISDSFFAVWAKDKKGNNLPGRKYIGIFMPGTGSIRSTEVRVGALLASAVLQLPETHRDPWWTNLWFFNSLKDLGNAISLFQNDIPKYIKNLKRRDGVEIRYLNRPEELTSRRQNSEIPKILQELSISYPPLKGKKVWDTCLASNIIEVGIDIDRLSLMTVVSQPKSTAQYIQVTGRVGRRWDERPGMVVVLYSHGRPRDLSHFEHFRSYHEKLYSQVEPTSVTPFASPVVLRALRGAVTSLLRLTSPIGDRPKNISIQKCNYVNDVFIKRIEKITGISKEEKEFLILELQEVFNEINKWKNDDWEGENGLLVKQESDKVKRSLTWAIPNSMRNVDATVATDITSAYHEKNSLEGIDV